LPVPFFFFPRSQPYQKNPAVVLFFSFFHKGTPQTNCLPPSPLPRAAFYVTWTLSLSRFFFFPPHVERFFEETGRPPFVPFFSRYKVRPDSLLLSEGCWAENPIGAWLLLGRHPGSPLSFFSIVSYSSRSPFFYRRVKFQWHP